MEENKAKSQIEHLEYSRDVSNAHSKAVQRLLDLYLNYIKNGEKAAKEGKNVIWAGFISPQLFYACDAIPISYAEIARIGSEESVSIAEQDYQLPNEVCSMVKAMVGEYQLKKDTTFKRIANVSSICEPINVAMPVIREMGYDIHLVDVGFAPKEPERKEALREHYKQEMERLAEWIWNQPIDKERLREEMKRYNRIQRKIRTIINLRRYHTTYALSLPTMILLAGNADLWGKPEEYEDILDALIEELSALNPDEYNDAKVNLIWSGGRGQEFGAYAAVDDAKGALIGWSIPNNLENEYDTTIDPLEALVKFTLGDKFIGTGDTQDAIRSIERLIEFAGAKGIIQYGFVGCSFASIDMELKREYFQQIGIPSVSILGAFQVGQATGQTVTRIQAFIEMLS